jgi:hypothetical protein
LQGEKDVAKVTNFMGIAVGVLLKVIKNGRTETGDRRRKTEVIAGQLPL